MKKLRGLGKVISIALYAIGLLMVLVRCQTATPTPAQDDVLLVRVPAGEFIAGSRHEDIVWFREQWDELGGSLRKVEPTPDYANELPQRTVYLDEFYIDKYEVSNARYQGCVEAGVCNPPQSEHYADPTYANYPVVEVAWTDADTFCRWVGKRLPTELEWEKAARGTDGRFWPWGNEWEKGLVYDGGRRTSRPVGSFPADTSPYGVRDMAGNVKEWVSDWYLPYAGSPYRDEDLGERFKVARGGGFSFDFGLGMRTAYRAWHEPDAFAWDRGFRCLQGGTAPTPEPTHTPGPTATPDAAARDMVLVREGEFLMGNDAGDPDERPEHVVYLDAFYIDRCEVSNAQFVAFLNDIGGHIRFCKGQDCTTVKRGCCRGGHIIQGRPYTVEPGYEDHPVESARWEGALAYCEHYGLRLPTEAEWEKAARGTDGRTWPWGNEWDPANIVLGDPFVDPVPVCSNPSGASPYGVLNMADNAGEWVSDWYDEGYYAVSLSHNPQGPESGLFKAYRSGINLSSLEDDNTRITKRGKSGAYMGFRCAVSVYDIEKP